MHLMHARGFGHWAKQWAKEHDRRQPLEDAAQYDERDDSNREKPVPPDVSAMTETSHCEKPDCVNAQAIAVAVPMISITAPVSNAVSMSIG